MRIRCFALVALLALCCALPVSNKAAAPADSPPTVASNPPAPAAAKKPFVLNRPKATTPKVPSQSPHAVPPKPATAGVPQEYSTLQQLKGVMLASLSAGASKVQAVLKSVGVNMGKPDEWIFKKRDMHREYDDMTSWWCRSQQNNKAGEKSGLCAKRDLAARLKTMSGDAKKAVLAQAKRDSLDPVLRKKVADEAKKMVDQYCKTHSESTGAPGAGSSICKATTSVLDMRKKLFNRTLKAPTTAPALPSKGPAATFPL